MQLSPTGEIIRPRSVSPGQLELDDFGQFMLLPQRASPIQKIGDGDRLTTFGG